MNELKTHRLLALRFLFDIASTLLIGAVLASGQLLRGVFQAVVLLVLSFVLMWLGAMGARGSE